MRVSVVVAVLLALGAWYLGRPPPHEMHEVPPLPPARPERVHVAAQVLLRGVQIEDFAFADDGTVVAGAKDGALLRFADDEFHSPETLLRSGQWLVSGKQHAGRFWFLLSFTGLVSFSLDSNRVEDMRLHTLHVDGRHPTRLNFPNHVTVGRDGRVFFSDSFFSSVPREHPEVTLVQSLFSGEASGRLLVFDPASNRTVALLGGLAFANGVEVAPDGSFVVVAEMMRARLWRVWLTGPQRGKADVFVDALPGFPDNLESDGTHLYVCLGLLRNAVTDFVFTNRWARQIVPRLPERPLGTEAGGFVRVNWKTGHTSQLFVVDGVHGGTTVKPHKEHIYVSSYFVDGFVARIPKQEIDALDP